MFYCDPTKFNSPTCSSCRESLAGYKSPRRLLGQYANDNVAGHFDGVVAKVKVVP